MSWQSTCMRVACTVPDVCANEKPQKHLKNNQWESCFFSKCCFFTVEDCTDSRSGPHVAPQSGRTSLYHRPKPVGHRRNSIWQLQTNLGHTCLIPKHHNRTEFPSWKTLEDLSNKLGEIRLLPPWSANDATRCPCRLNPTRTFKNLPDENSPPYRNMFLLYIQESTGSKNHSSHPSEKKKLQ